MWNTITIMVYLVHHVYPWQGIYQTVNQLTKNEQGVMVSFNYDLPFSVM